jgi:hypothetical protein
MLPIGFDEVDVLPTTYPTRDPLGPAPDDNPTPGAGRNEESNDMLGADQETDGNAIPIKEKDNQSGEDISNNKQTIASS